MPTPSGKTRLTRLLVAICAMPLAACSTTTGGSGEGPGTRPGQAPALKQLWQRAVGGPPATEQQLVGGSADAKRVYVSDVSGHVYALDAKTGALAWTRRPGARTGFGVGVTGSRALFFDTDLGVFALDSTTGAAVWSKQAVNLGGGRVYVPAAADGIVALKTVDGLIGVRLDTGRTAWSIPPEKTRFVLANPASDGKLLFALAGSANSDTLVGLEPTTGATRWAAPVPVGAAQANAPVLAVYSVGPIVLVVSQVPGLGSPATLMAFDAATGHQRWIVTAVGPTTTGTAPILVGDQVLFATLKGIQAFAVATGRSLFTAAMDTGGSTEAVGRCGTAPCAIGLTQLSVVDTAGKVVAKVAVPDDAGGLVTSPAGVVFLLSSSTVYALG